MIRVKLTREFLSFRALHVGSQTYLAPSCQAISTTQGYGPPAVEFSVTLGYTRKPSQAASSSLASLTAGHPWAFRTTPRSPPSRQD